MSIKEKIFYDALRIRMVEEKIVEVYPSDKIQSPVHLSIGQEHHIAGLCNALEKSDQIFTSYRSHAVYLAKGGDMKQMFAELYGKHDGMAKGKAGSMHLCSPEVGLMGSSAIVAAVLPHALGAAYALKNYRNENLVVCVTGDGATEEGVFHECLNFASLKSLPILFVIENNGLAIHSHLKDRQAYDLQKLADAYGIDFVIAEDGFDMENIYNITKELRKKIKDQSRPMLFEIKTYRYKAHVGIHDDHNAGYRGKEVFKKWYSRDPLVSNKPAIDKLKDQIKIEIDQAVEYAENSLFPPYEELLKDVH